ncbi:nuclear transport factor 2 family protein [Sphingomonas sp. TX0543]|uniref:nuclear transport factor 2 family protein n=1 Tax=unclassified Sphingomonas TaxID=196159 RepID=UPI0010F5A039|nr:nuclear transport factor 2 family protein [Sphingomonas sp. 3P27F8]
MIQMSLLADRLAIQDVLCRYARGIDRCDEAVLRAVWWPGAQADYGNGFMDAGDWSGGVVKALGAMRRTQHFLGNMLIEIDGDRATAETYCRAYHEVDGAERPEEMEVGGRYLDRLEKRGGEWRIAHRRYVHDWNRNTPSTASWDGPLYGGLSRIGARAPHDPSYTGD